jgi:hypothetical protein
VAWRYRVQAAYWASWQIGVVGPWDFGNVSLLLGVAWCCEVPGEMPQRNKAFTLSCAKTVSGLGCFVSKTSRNATSWLEWVYDVVEPHGGECLVFFGGKVIA